MHTGTNMLCGDNVENVNELYIDMTESLHVLSHEEVGLKIADSLIHT